MNFMSLEKKLLPMLSIFDNVMLYERGFSRSHGFDYGVKFSYQGQVCSFTFLQVSNKELQSRTHYRVDGSLFDLNTVWSHRTFSLDDLSNFESVIRHEIEKLISSHQEIISEYKIKKIKIMETRQLIKDRRERLQRAGLVVSDQATITLSILDMSEELLILIEKEAKDE